MERLLALSESIQSRYHALSRTAKAFLGIWIAIQLTLIAFLIIVTPARVFQALAEWAKELRESTFGWLLLVGVIAVTSFPPLFGYTTAVTCCGFAYGIREGFFIALAGTLFGASGSFLLARTLFTRYAQTMLEGQTTLRALGSAVKSKGTPLIWLIRLCPFPYSYSNVFFASLSEVTFGRFILATCGLAPKLLLHVYIGTRLYLFSDPANRHNMDRTSKILNSLSIVFSLLLGAGVGWWVYRLTMGYVAEGQLTLADEEEIDAFLEQEGELEAEEEGRAGVSSPEEGYEVNADADGETTPRPSQDAWGGFDDFDREEAGRKSTSVER